MTRKDPPAGPFYLPPQPEPGDDRPRNAFGVLESFGEAMAAHYAREDRLRAAAPLDYYREANGDYLAVLRLNHRQHWPFLECRAAAIAGLPASVCSCGARPEYVKGECQPVARADVPPEWLRYIDGGQAGD